MRWRNTPSRYGLVASALHWTIVIGVIAQYVLAEAGEGSDDAASGALDAMNLHMSIGVTLLALALVRAAWRFVDPAPVFPERMERYESMLARGVHVLFYVVLLALPISGWLLATLEGESLRFFGLFDLPAFTGVTAASEETIEEVHEVLFNILFGLALLHVAAALKHRFIDHDDVLQRMLPGRK
jgi:cytochrome b561